MNIQGLPLSNIDLNSTATRPSEKSGEFGQMLKDAVSQVDQSQADAQAKVTDVMKGNGGDLHSAMIAVEKADLSFQMMLQVRNKIVAAYQEISHLSF